jgi:CRP-like cAMP-binding protein
VQPADYFKQIPLFCDLNPEEIMDVLRIARVVSFKAGSKLCTRGAVADCAYLLEAGEVSIRASEEGQAEVELARAGAGEILGELALIDGHPRSADVIALSDVRGYRIDRSELDAMRKAMHPAAFKILRRIAITVSDRLRDLNEAIAEELAKSGKPRMDPQEGGKTGRHVVDQKALPSRPPVDSPAPSRAATRASREFGRTSREFGRVSQEPSRTSKAAPQPAPPRTSKAAPAPQASRTSKVAAQPAPSRTSKAAPSPAFSTVKSAPREEPSFWRSMLDRLSGTSLK